MDDSKTVVTAISHELSVNDKIYFNARPKWLKRILLFIIRKPYPEYVITDVSSDHFTVIANAERITLSNRVKRWKTSFMRKLSKIRRT